MPKDFADRVWRERPRRTPPPATAPETRRDLCPACGRMVDDIPADSVLCPECWQGKLR